MDQEDLQMKKLLKVILLVAVTLTTYVAYVNRNAIDMTARQKILKAFYPVFSGINKIFGLNNAVLVNDKNHVPVKSLYDIEVVMNDGSKKSMADFKGKKLLIVNTASDCGYTGQFDGLQDLYEREKGNLTILGFPANDFKEQEKGNDDEIASFCRRNYGVTFPLAAKGSVIKGPDQQTVFRWLTDKGQNGWNGKQPAWNFSKYLVSEDGRLLNYFGPAVEPTSQEIKNAIKH